MKIVIDHVYPMNFTEFLMAEGSNNLCDYIKSIETIENISEAFYNPLYEKLKMYYVTGGMPEVVENWITEHDPNEIQRILRDIISAYERDFAKHPEIHEVAKINLIWKSLPSQLAKENKKFLYSVVKNGARAREYENALQWLVDTGLTYKIFRSSKPGLPVSAY